MIYYLSDRYQREKAKERFEKCFKGNSTIELTTKSPNRSIRQNSYLHLILGAYGLEYGLTIEEVKGQIFKGLVNKDLFYVGLKDVQVVVDEIDISVKIEEFKSSSKLTKEEMTLAINRFLDFSATNGFRLPEPSDLKGLDNIKNQIKQNKQYL